jgi:hypothetical protein
VFVHVIVTCPVVQEEKSSSSSVYEQHNDAVGTNKINVPMQWSRELNGTIGPDRQVSV